MYRIVIMDQPQTLESGDYLKVNRTDETDERPGRWESVSSVGLAMNGLATSYGVART